MTRQAQDAPERERYGEDALFFEAHREELLGRYPEQWVAVFDGQVVGAHADLERLLDLVQERGFPVGQVFVEQVTAKDQLLILCR